MDESASNPFDTLAERYDRWFESPRGRVVFSEEVACLQPLVETVDRGPWVEIGVGTGRFAEALGVPWGLDPSRPVLAIARRRGLKVVQATAEALPLADESVAGLLCVVTICFVQDPARLLLESHRVLRPGGRIVVGLVPKSSPWGRRYEREAAAGHPFYRAARFYDVRDVVSMAERAGLGYLGARSCLFWGPDTPPANGGADIRDGAVPHAGFVGLLFVR